MLELKTFLEKLNEKLDNFCEPLWTKRNFVHYKYLIIGLNFFIFIVPIIFWTTVLAVCDACKTFLDDLQYETWEEALLLLPWDFLYFFDCVGKYLPVAGQLVLNDYIEQVTAISKSIGPGYDARAVLTMISFFYVGFIVLCLCSSFNHAGMLYSERVWKNANRCGDGDRQPCEAKYIAAECHTLIGLNGIGIITKSLDFGGYPVTVSCMLLFGFVTSFLIIAVQCEVWAIRGENTFFYSSFKRWGAIYYRYINEDVRYNWIGGLLVGITLIQLAIFVVDGPGTFALVLGAIVAGS